MNLFHPARRSPLGGSALAALLDEFAHGAWPLAGRMPGTRRPAVNLWSDDEAVHVEAELPGLALADVEVSVLDQELTLSGQRPAPEEDGTAHRRERQLGSFRRVLRLPGAVDADRVTAVLEDGVLTVTLPLAAELRPRRIPVVSAAG